MNNETDISLKFKNSITGESKLEKYAETLSKISSLASGLDSGILKQLDDGANSTAKMNKDIKTATGTSDKLGKTLGTAFSGAGILAFAKSLKNVTIGMSQVVNKSMNFVEAINLFQVAFRGDTQEAEKFINTLSEMYGLDESWLTNTTSMFKQLSNAMGLADETGSKLSKALTQLSIDTSSLYNIDPNEAVEKFASALAGQTKPVRALGADITQATLQNTLIGLGIDQSVANLSYAEKRLVIVISLMQQLSGVTNDWAKTIESPANQTRILSEQWERLSRAIGNLFLPILTKILPYLNAILMVLTEIISTIATLFGYDAEEFDYGVGVTTDSIAGLSDGLATATGNSEKLKKSLMGLRSFDKLNVIKTPSADTGGGTSGGGVSGGGISGDILGAFDKTYQDYMDKLENVSMKATKIRDKIMEWLGFTKQIDSKTGDVSFKFDHITAGTVLGALAIGGTIYKGINTILKLLAKVGLIKEGTTLSGIISAITKNISKLLSSIKNGTLITTIATKVGTLASKLATIAAVIVGITTQIKSLKTQSNIVTQTLNGNLNKTQAITSLLATQFASLATSMAAGFAVGGPIGAGIAGILSLLSSAVTVIKTAKKELRELAAADLFGTVSISTEQWINILNASTTTVTDFSNKIENLNNNLSAYKTSFENATSELDLFGYKFGVVGVQISDEDAPKITAAINNMCTSAYEIISQNTELSLTMWGDTFSNMSTITEEEEQDILTSIFNYGESQKKEIADAQTKITKTYDNAIKTRGYLTDEEYNYIQEQLAKIRQLTESEMKKNQTNVEYYKSVFKDKNNKLDEESYTSFKEALQGYEKDKIETIEGTYNTLLNQAKYYYDTGAINEKEYNNMVKTAYDQRVKDTETLRAELDDIQQGVYEDLANTYKEIQNNTDVKSKETKKIIENIFKDIKVDKKDIVSQFSTIGKDCSDGLNNNLKFKSSKFDSSYNTWLDNIGSSVTKLNASGVVTAEFTPYKYKVNPYVRYAQGGLPPVGQLFVANERGPELVGQIGGQTFVANQNQMMDLLDKKIGNAGSGVQNATFIIQVGSKEVAKTVLTDLGNMAKSNGKPITITGN